MVKEHKTEIQFDSLNKEKLDMLIEFNEENNEVVRFCF